MTSNISEALAVELDRREQRNKAVATVGARLQAETDAAAAEHSDAAAAEQDARARRDAIRSKRDRLAAEHADASNPAAKVAAAERELAAAVERTRSVPIDDDAAETAAAEAQAAAEAKLQAARDTQGRGLRPLALRVATTDEHLAAATKDLEAAGERLMDAEVQLHRARVKQLRLRRDAASMALEEAIVDLTAAGTGGSGDLDLTIGGCAGLRHELGMKEAERPNGWGLTSRAQALRPVNPAVLLSLAGMPESTRPATVRKPLSLAA